MPSTTKKVYSYLQLYAAEIAYKLAQGEVDEAKATTLIIKAGLHYAQTRKRSQLWKRSYR